MLPLRPAPQMSRNSTFARSSHASHFLRCITGLPGSKSDLDTSRLGIAYYCLSGLDLLDVIQENNSIHPEEWREWIWSQLVRRGSISGFRTGTASVASNNEDTNSSSAKYDQPHLIMTYTAILSLSILRDDFSQLDRSGVLNFLNSTQHPDGSFSPLPVGTISSERDLRLTFCAFAICSMLDDWSTIDVDQAIRFVQRCRTYEGGYGEGPGAEAQGGPTYCALASMTLAAKRMHPDGISEERPLVPVFLSPAEVKETTRWLVQKQKGGFQGRTGKSPDACYCFWCGAALKILDADTYVEKDDNASFLSRCQYKHGGIAKSPGESSDPYHTYLAMASLALYPPTETWRAKRMDNGPSWNLEKLDPLLNLRVETAEWARRHIPDPQQNV